MRVVRMLFAAAALLACAVGCHRVLHLTFPPMAVQAALPGRPPPPPPPPPPPEAKQISISDRIEFETDSAALQDSSFKVLDQVVEVLKANPDLKLIEVQGHTDATGTAEHNRQLSQARAESVREYLLNGGIDAARVRAKGYGQDKPLADNTSEEGKQKNRRVEFHIIERAPQGAAQ